MRRSRYCAVGSMVDSWTGTVVVVHRNVSSAHKVFYSKINMFPINPEKFKPKPLYFFTNSNLAPGILNPYNFSTVAPISSILAPTRS
jgi:hypothetical protein